ncbi:hypothetical protein [Microcella sp.]|uniref:hypothetical protein n=1 Tax=Microcella sp. TaxID=1913979 RepID=UPI00299F6819|nr:hypothetical protein [Microcella sp.]MDX2026736.1 hypothetical protein [Microcella sp.]
MNPDDLRAVLLDLAGTISGVHVDVGRTDAARHPESYIKLTSLTDPEAFAIVSATGSGSYELTVNGGFSTGTADDQSMEPHEVREYLASFVRAALAYLDGSWSMRKSRFLKVPTISIEKDGSVLNLVPRGRASTNDYRLPF